MSAPSAAGAPPPAPPLDARALLSIARQFWAARSRLALRTGGNIPTATELAIALRMYVADRDRDRQRHALSAPRTPTPASCDAARLLHYLALAEAAYANAEHELSLQLDSLEGDCLLEARWLADKWQPGYFVCRDRGLDLIVLSVRGSKEASDFVTNLSAETEPFLHGYGHQGIVMSARNLHHRVRPRLAAYLDTFRPANGLVLVGHSLGGAVAAALAMTLRAPAADGEDDNEGESTFARAAFRAVKAYSFSGPPFVSENLARESRAMGITTVVSGLDIVPRLSAASLDRLLVSVSRYDWSTEVGQTIGRALEAATSGILGEESARTVSQAIAHGGVGGITMASSAIGETARMALRNRGETSSSMWSLALNATVFATSLINNQLSSPQRQQERAQRDYPFAAQFGMSADDVEELMVEEPPPEVFLAGRVFHLDVPFTSPSTPPADSELPQASYVEMPVSSFRDVEPSAWMIYHHHVRFINTALATLL